MFLDRSEHYDEYPLYRKFSNESSCVGLALSRWIFEHKTDCAQMSDLSHWIDQLNLCQINNYAESFILSNDNSDADMNEG